jgi:hypothetical protein
MATNTVITNIAPTRVQTTAPKLSKADRDRLTHALAELHRLDARLDEVNNLRDAIAEAARGFAKGDLTLGQAAGLAGIEQNRLADVRGVLRHGPKMLAKEIVESVADLVEGHRQHAVDDLLDRCKQMETAERENARNVGIGDDDFRPSGLLESLREQHRRANGLIGTLITRSDLNQLAKAAGVPIPTGEADGEDTDEAD